MAGLRFDAGDFSRRLSVIEQRQQFAIETYGKAAGNKMVADAKKSHPWANRTYFAERTITGSTGWSGSHFQIRLHGGVMYDVFLEFKVFTHKGRLSIFFPTVRKWTPEVLAGWADRMKEV